MAASTAVRFQVVGSGPRRVVAVSPVARPEFGGPVAHPARPVAPGRIRPAASCAVERPRRSPWLAVRVALVGVVAAVGAVASVAQFVENAQPDPALGYVAGDPAWAHVTGR